MTGADGTTGPQGPIGLTGADGATGPQGPIGLTGVAGVDGISVEWQGSLASAPLLPQTNWGYYNTTDGISYVYDGTFWQTIAQDGIDGVQGPQGDPGPQGPIGLTGADGAVGPAGPKGDTGLTGATGSAGPKGDQGIQGFQGPAGLDGAPGDSHWLLNGLNTYYSAGNVGIGTTAPGHILESVVSSSQAYASTGDILADQSGGVLFSVVNSNASGDYSTIRLGTRTSAQSTWDIVNERTGNYVGDLIFRTRTGLTTSAERIRVLNNGNVGIGTTNPLAPLHIEASGALPELLIEETTATDAAEIRLKNTTRTWSIYGDSSPDHFAIMDKTAGEVHRLVIDNTGNVGIGTTSPVSELDVAGTVNATAFTGDGSGLTGVASTDTTLTETQVDAFVANNGYSTGAHTTDTTLTEAQVDAFVTNNGYSTGAHTVDTDTHGTDSWTDGTGQVTTTGNVGIGTAGPATKLSMPTSTSRLSWGTPGGGSYSLGASGGGAILFGVNGDSEYIAFETHESGVSHAERMRITGTGNVGIGTTTPQGKLDVDGSIFQRGSSLHADYVFESDYELESIKEHAEFMWKNKHLKAIPKAKVDEDGKEIVEVGSHRKGIVEELEKAHIYISQLHQQSKTMEDDIREVKAENKAVKAENEKLRENLTALADRQEALEDMFLAISINLPKEKLVKLDQPKLNKLQKIIQ